MPNSFCELFEDFWEELQHFCECMAEFLCPTEYPEENDRELKDITEIINREIVIDIPDDIIHTEFSTSTSSSSSPEDENTHSLWFDKGDFCIVKKGEGKK